MSLSMERLVTYGLICFLLALVPGVLMAQSSNDLGMMGGSGITVTPTAAVTPESHFRLDMTRISLLRTGGRGVNSFALTNGFSSNVEFTMKFQSLQSGNALSPSFVGIGGKVVLPFETRVVNKVALWMEAESSPSRFPETFMPSVIYRGLVVVQPSLLRVINGNLLLGMSSAEQVNRFSAGFNVSRTFTDFAKVGGELQYNYYGNGDLQESALLLIRALPNVCIQVSPGYLRSPMMSSWMISAGVSFSTSNIDFVTVDKVKEQAPEIPSIDDLEKEIRGEKKNDK